MELRTLIIVIRIYNRYVTSYLNVTFQVLQKNKALCSRKFHHCFYSSKESQGNKIQQFFPSDKLELSLTHIPGKTAPRLGHCREIDVRGPFDTQGQLFNVYTGTICTLVDIYQWEISLVACQTSTWRENTDTRGVKNKQITTCTNWLDLLNNFLQVLFQTVKW